MKAIQNIHYRDLTNNERKKNENILPGQAIIQVLLWLLCILLMSPSVLYIVYGTFFNLSNKNCSCIFRGFLKMTIASKYKNKKVNTLK